MATVTATATENLPRTANLLACKQWWRVCFLYGDQEKYYRQVYGRAASQRIASSNVGASDVTQQPNDSSSETTTGSGGGGIATNGRFGNGPTPTLFPSKQPSRRRSKTNSTERTKQSSTAAAAATTPASATLASRREDLKLNRKITVLDDPFLFGMNEHANLSEDSGIDNAAFESTSAPPPLKPKKSQRQFNDVDLHRDLCNDLKINENDLRMLHMSRRNRSGVAIAAGVVNESFSFSSESEEQRQGQGSPASSSSSAAPPPLSPRRRDVPLPPPQNVSNNNTTTKKE